MPELRAASSDSRWCGARTLALVGEDASQSDPGQDMPGAVLAGRLAERVGHTFEHSVEGRNPSASTKLEHVHRAVGQASERCGLPCLQADPSREPVWVHRWQPGWDGRCRDRGGWEGGYRWDSCGGNGVGRQGIGGDRGPLCRRLVVWHCVLTTRRRHQGLDLDPIDDPAEEAEDSPLAGLFGLGYPDAGTVLLPDVAQQALGIAAFIHQALHRLCSPPRSD